MANVTTNFLPIQGQKAWRMIQAPMIASVAIGEGAAVFWVGDGTVDKVTNLTGNFAGLLAQPITSTDDDFATSRKRKGIWVPRDTSAEAEFTVGAGTFTSADEGKSVEFNDEISLAVDTAGIQARITQFISSTRGKCVFNQDIT